MRDRFDCFCRIDNCDCRNRRDRYCATSGFAVAKQPNRSQADTRIRQFEIERRNRGLVDCRSQVQTFDRATPCLPELLVGSSPQ